MYKKVNITENHLQVLSLFTKGFDKEYYIREVHKLLKISPRTSQLILDDLEKKSVLESRTRGKIKTYKIKKSNIAKEYIIFAEEHKKLCFLKTQPLISEIIAKIIPFIKGVGLIFGSYAKGTEKEGSDLDIFIAGKCNKKEIKKVSKLYGIDTNIKQYPTHIFEKNINTDILIKEIKDNHIIFLNAEEFVSIVLKNG